MNLTVREIAWAIVSENAVRWNLEYRSELGMGPDIEGSVDMLYSGRCNDMVNRIARTPVPLDETVILLDRFWARECEAAKSEDFTARVSQIVSRYDEIVFESADVSPAMAAVPIIPDAGPEPVIEPSTGQKKSEEAHYAFTTSIEIVSPHLLRLTALDEDGIPLCRILLDPIRVRKLHEMLGSSMAEYEAAYAEINFDGLPASRTTAGAAC